MATQLGAIKRVRGFPGVNVDGFNYQSPDVTAYFLTHYHADHTCGLHAGFKGPAPIYCTPPTAALLTAVTGVRPSLVRAVAVGDDAAVPLADGGEAVVTFLDANHCPGSALLHFRHRSTNRVVLHTGDFRASRAVRDDPLLAALLRAHGRVDELMLDTTYCDPRWTFPDRDVACEAMAEIVRRELRREPRTLFLVGSYAVGKERAVRAVARAAGTRAGVGWHRARTLKLTGWWDETLFVCEDDERAVEAAMREEAERERRRRRVKMLPRGRGDGDERADAEDPSDPSSGENLSSGDAFAPPACRVRVTPMGGGAPHEAMAEMMERTHVDPRTNRPWFRAVVSFRPTGWSYARGRGRARGGAGAGAAREEAGAERGNDEAGEKGVKEEGVKEEGVKEEGVKEEGVKEEVNASVKVSEVKPEVIEAEVASAGIRAGAFSSSRAVSVASGSSPSPASLLADACRPWVENGGATRCYSVPYSEHSSFDELVAFVERVRPARVTPTVNAATRGDRERLLRHFLRFTDARADPGKLDHYFIKGKAPEVTKREEERVASELGTRGAAGGGGEREKGASAPPGASLPRPLPDPEDEAAPPAHDPDALAAVRAALDLDPSELRQQEALWRAAKDAAAREKMREDANGGADLGAFPLGCVALVRGGGGGGGGLGPGAGGGAAFAHFRDRAHVEDRLRALGATIVKRLSPKVTHVVVPSGGEALAEERRKHRSVAGGRRAADADPKTPKGSSKGGDENTRDDALGRPPERRPPLALPGVGEAGAGAGALETDAGARGVDSASDSPPPGPAPRVVTESWVMRHWRAREAGVAETHSASAIDAHRRAARESRRREADETKKRKARELASGVEVRPGRPRAMSKATLDRVARALSQRLFLIRRVDRSRGDADASESPRTDRGNNGNLPPREAAAAAHATTKPGGTHPSSGTWHSSFAVFGSTGNAYECEVRATPSCTCPDFVGAAAASSGRRACKHLLWVYMRVLGVSRDDPLLAQAHLLQAELEAMLARPSAAQRAQSAAASVRAAYRAAVVSAEEEEEEEDVSLCAPAPARRQPLRATAPGEDEPRCPVCFDDIVDAADRAAAAAAAGLGGGNPPASSPESPKNHRRVEDEGDDADPTGLEDGSSGWTNYATKTRASVWWCSAGCGGNVHARCAEAWFAKSGDRACPLCRAPWLAQAEGDVLGAGWALPGAGTGATLNGGAAGDAVDASAAATMGEASPGGARYVNLRRFQAGTAAGRDLEQYGSFARRAIEKREREERRKSRDPEGGG